MTIMDKITEEIAHFIGVFHISVEDARFREAHPEFSFDPVQSELDPLPVIDTDFAAPYQLLGYEPGLDYRSPGPAPWHPYLRPAAFEDTPHPQSVDGPVPGNTEYDWPKHEAAAPSHGTTKFIPPEIEPPGSVVNHLNQAIALSDDDYFGVGGHSLVFSPDPIDNSELFEGAEATAALSPIGDLERPGSSAEIIAVIKTSISQLDAAESGAGDSVQVFTTAETIEGVYVNGELVAEAPKLEDYHSFDGEEEESEDDLGSNTWTMEDGTVAIEASVELEAGGNTLVNDAVLKSFWTGGTVTAVVGDHVELNAIVQINALWDVDAITSAVGDATNADANELFNSATFERLDASNEPDTDAASAGDYPKYWSITEVEGDLMIVNWLEQFIFMSDNDVGILSSSGVTTSVVSGDNLGVNHTSIFELGFAYDLIIVGGSVYDANIIHQINILFDNDVVGAVSGFQTTGQATVSSSANLLWNQAYISNIGNPDRFDALPQQYLDAANALAGGNGDMSHNVLSDAAFAGLEGLHVLYISGDLIKLQSIQQTNILGDSDQIALAMDAIVPHLDAGWSISTGSNALLNNAAIVDLDSFGRTYVGGDQYSQETLYQAELISRQPDFGSPDPDALVTEAVLFLDDSMLDPTDAAAFQPDIAPEYDAHPDDGVNSVLGH
ncbi:hypothetical protein [Pararhizobium sp. LjRoot238]|uniref:hypothetical protein n=1 Tax=Pararhizobium sp. LjRoot238 TaxID=3342293 RepID=UPI003ECDC8D0